jgi:hypothetical protein
MIKMITARIWKEVALLLFEVQSRHLTDELRKTILISIRIAEF